MLTVIVNGEVYCPEPEGTVPIVVCGPSIAHVGEVDLNALTRTRLPFDVLDAAGCIVAPGIIDSHEHLAGGSGEDGFNSQTPEIMLHEIVSAGITTVVGCLGTDTITRTTEGLLGKAKGLRQDGISAYLWSGGYDVPPVTVTGSVRRDIVLLDEVIGGGETAISDARSSVPSTHELARLVKANYVGGILTGKAGVTHFHVGEESSGLAPIRALLDEYGARPESLYPTHVNRSGKLISEAVELTRRGVSVDMDTVDLELQKWLSHFLEEGGDHHRLTISSDAATNSPAAIWDQLRGCIHHGIVDLPRALSFITTNAARVLRLSLKGSIQIGRDADLMILHKDSLEIRDVFARGVPLLRNGRMQQVCKSMIGSNRVIELHGAKTQ